MTEKFTLRPRKLRIMCWILAATLVAGFSVLSFALGSTTAAGTAFAAGDQGAMIGIGVLFAAGVLWIGRPRVEADQEGVQIRNFANSVYVPWSEVAAVTFPAGASWPQLELHTQDTVSIHAIQTVDKEHAVTAMRHLRALHSSSPEYSA